MKPIYIPKGAAKEYGDYAINIYTGCPHRCYYCFAPAVLHIDRETFHSHVEPRAGIVEAVRQQLEKEKITGKLIHLCFTCDPYPKGYDCTATREIIKLLKDSGNHVQILTKNGFDAQRDLDLLDGDDWFGITYAGYQSLLDCGFSEPNAGSPGTRLYVVQIAHNMGIKTWVSMEPVLCAEDALKLLSQRADDLPQFRYIDRFKIGKLNYHPSSINWAEFGREVERICKEHGLDYYIKDGLRKEMEADHVR